MTTTRKIFNIYLISGLISATIPILAYASPMIGNSVSSAESAAPSTGNSISDSATAPSTGASISSAPPSTGDSFSSAAPSTGDSVSSAAPSTGDSVSSADSGATTDNSNTPANTGVVSGGSSGFISGSSGGGGFYYGNLPIQVVVSTSSCPLITSYLKMGADNSPVEVTKLQAFLKRSLDIDVDINGIFDQKTESAVEAFQTAYLSDVLGPWNTTQPSGYVYITTSKKINELACKSLLTLNVDELAIINAYISRFQNGSQDQSGNHIGPLNSDDMNASGTASTSNEFGQKYDENSNVANAGNPSILQRFWDFILSLFRKI